MTLINHNTKLFTFELPEKDSTLGLVVNSCLLTMYKGPTDEKPTVRPYTPISDVDQQVPYPPKAKTPFTSPFLGCLLTGGGNLRLVGEKV